MDILEVKKMGEFDQSLQNIIRKLKIDENPILLKGSASLKSHKYFGDYDLYTNVTEKLSPERFFERFTRILTFINNNPNLYFTELKIQNDNGVKYKYMPGDNFTYDKFKEQFKHIDFVKIDFVYYYDNRFIEVSVNYFFKKHNQSEKDFIADIHKSIKELKNDKNYFKMLKRYFILAKHYKENDKMLKLLNIFNSDIGKEYQKLSNLEALRLVHQYYDDDVTNKRILLNLRELSLKPQISEIDNFIRELNNKINNKIKNII